MGCNGKVLTKEQVNMLQFMINNYNKKNMDICSCDVERVLDNKELELTKLEKAVTISMVRMALGEEEVMDYLEKCMSEHSAKEFLETVRQIANNTTINETREASMSILKKLINGLLEKETIPPIKK